MSAFAHNPYKLSHPQPPGGQNLLAGDGVDNGEVPLDAYDDQNEDARRVAQRLNEQVHFAEEFAQHPAGKNNVTKINQKGDIE